MVLVYVMKDTTEHQIIVKNVLGLVEPAMVLKVQTA